MGERDPAQPLLTLYDGMARVELSGATTANWVAKTANLLVDGVGIGGDESSRIGLLLPLHWQSVVLLLAGIATGSTVVLAQRPADLAGCPVAFTTADTAEEALDAGVEDVFALSCHPLGARLGTVPALVLDYAVEVPSYGDHWGGRHPTTWHVEVGGRPLVVPPTDLGPADRVLTALPLAGVGWLLAALSAGAGIVLVPDAASVDLPAVVAAERVTATAGIRVGQLAQLDG